jgi:hypothetical protein
MPVRNDDSITVTCILLYISHYFVMKVFFFFFTVRSCWRWMHLIVFYRFVYIWAAKNCCMAGYLQPLIYSKRLNVELLINEDLNKGFLFNLHFSLLCTLPQVFFSKFLKTYLNTVKQTITFSCHVGFQELLAHSIFLWGNPILVLFIYYYHFLS